MAPGTAIIAGGPRGWVIALTLVLFLPVYPTFAQGGSASELSPKSEAGSQNGPGAGQEARSSVQQKGKLPADPSAVSTLPGYKVDVVATDFNYPVDLAFGPDGEMYVAEAGGHTYGTGPEKAPSAQIVRIRPGGKREVVFDKVVALDAIRNAQVQWEPTYRISGIPEGVIPPITGLTYNEKNGLLYVSHRTRYSTLNPKTGEFKTIIDGIPSWGEFLNHKAVFGPDGRMVFFLSTQGNTGPVDGHMTRVMKVFNKPGCRELSCEPVTLRGVGFQIDDPFDKEKGKVWTGAYLPLGVKPEDGMVVPGYSWCHGAFYSATPDGKDIKRIAWGLRSNFGYAFSPDGRLVSTMNSANIMEPRPVYDDWETIWEISEGAWYGWPDYYSGLPIVAERFKRPNDPDFKKSPFPHEYTLTEETRKKLLKDQPLPPQPLVRLPVHSAAEGMVFGREEFGLPGELVIVAEFGAIIPYYKEPFSWPGFRVQGVDLQTSEAFDFLINKSRKPGWVDRSGGLRRPIQVTWGPDGALYVTDFGVIEFSEQGMNAWPGTGVIWKVTHTGKP